MNSIGARSYRFRAVSADDEPEAEGSIILDTYLGRMLRVRFLAERQPSTLGRPVTDIDAAESLARDFAHRALGEWHRMQLRVRSALPDVDPIRYTFLWVQHNAEGQRTGTQAGASVWADGRGMRSFAGRAAPASRPAPRLTEHQAVAAAEAFLREAGLETTDAQAEIVLSWLLAPQQGPAWLVNAMARPAEDTGGQGRLRSCMAVIDAITGDLLLHSGGATP